MKQLHVLLAVLTAAGFCLRGYWMLVDSPRLGAAWTRRLPHVVDTLLLLTGIAMAVGLSISPLENPWLAAKLVAIVLYVVLGTVALKRGRTRGRRAAALALALLALAYIFADALTRDAFIGLG